MVDLGKKLLGGAAALSILVIACTTTVHGTGGGDGAGTDAGREDGASGAPDERPGDGDAGAEADRCAEEETLLDCAECCGGFDAVLPYNRTYIACACQGPCKEQCAETLCADELQDSDPACDSCLESQTTIAACDPSAQAACDADEACTRFTRCAFGAKCLEKPDE